MVTTEIHINLNKQPSSQSEVNILEELSSLIPPDGIQTDEVIDMELELECSEDGNYIIPREEESRIECLSIVGQNVQLQISFPDDNVSEHQKKSVCRCFLCKQNFSMETKYVRHMSADHNIKRPFKCPSCDYDAHNKKLILRHMKSMHKDEEEKDISEFCRNEMPTESKRSTSKIREWKCEECGIILKMRKSYILHKLRHKGDFNVKCLECNKSFVSENALKRHAISHSSIRNFVCDIENCGQTFKHQGALTDHKKQVHQIFAGKVCKDRCKKKIKTIPCPWESCDKKFRDRYNLKIHYATHTG
ncbi:hypothetical protein FSP39_001418 [Pinctada imbricata]|uniref:C2H2-type domain-containing protein n=1 Tax=Pinctada imbricata TaxID=66713 RepID=A0AA89C9L3_PINIB|nr:hypothetical protein FSP39_001418 [Pinctada imbricata]